MLSGCGGQDMDVPAGEEKEPEETPFSRLLTNQKLESKILKRSLDYAVLLPDGYDVSTDTYPVVYLLHGYGDDETAWYQGGGLRYNVDKNEDVAVPMIYVMPQGFNTYYINKYNGKFPYMDMFVKELVPTIDSLFRTKKNKTQRAVMGYSMGGYGALILPVMNPDVFSVSIPLSMSFRTRDQYLEETQGAFDIQWAPNFGPRVGASGESRFSDYYKEHSPFYFFDTDEISRFDGLKILIDCGDDEESLSKTNNEMHVLLRDHNIAHEYRVRSGAHSWNYWKEAYPEALAFISDAVQQFEYPEEPEPVMIDPLITVDDFQTIDVPGTHTSVNLLLPAQYSDDEAYPVVYFLNDHESEGRVDNTIKVFSLLTNAMTNDRIEKSILVEISAELATRENLPLADIIAYVDQEYKSAKSTKGRLLIGNGHGAALALEVSNDLSDLLINCFAFNPKFSSEMPKHNDKAFYYLDMTDEASGYKIANGFYLQMRSGEYEYRVRQGTETVQSFLNGLDQSLKEMKAKLKSE
ncbi:MAG: alpha/beta hydrolase-fold protein [Cyclobacteriaceae bacterium]